MQLIEELINFFGLDAISTAETFPELLQAIVCIIMACSLLLFVFRGFFSMNARIAKIDK